MAATTRRGRRGPRRVFSEAEILDAAQQLLDAGGPDAASVRGIAKQLGVAPNTIYTYFADKAAVTQALVERLLGGIDHGVFADPTRPWRQRVESLALELRAQLAAHPGAVGLIAAGPMSGTHALALNKRTRELFAEAGLDPADATRASHVLVVYIVGSLSLEVAHPTADDADPTSTDQYLWGLHRILDGITATPTTPDPPKTPSRSPRL